MRFLVRRSSEADPQQSSRNPHCSFCGKSKDKVQKLIAGPRVYICDECVELCNRILAEDSSH